MSVRVKALLFSLLVVSACTPDSVAAPPPSASAAQVASSTSALVPADRWHVVLIAGDSSSPAFDNGVEALSDKLRARGVRDVTALTSDPQANPSLPAATAANVSQALRGGGGEACLAFVTSHGDESGVVLRAANGMLAPQSFTNALTAGCGSRPTVVIVSACHSGVFMTNAMRQPNRIVMTAAAADRVSFGCGASDEYTYYDQCLLQQFDGVATWQQLAVATRSCVENLERRMGVRRPSQPQIFVGAQVANLRIPGR
ncbi:C13 family peptidase [soil metagenome]